jgi:hypothetical protein
MPSEQKDIRWSAAFRSLRILTVDRDEGVVGTVRRRIFQFVELLEIHVVCVLLEVASDSRFVAVGGGSVVSNGVVKLPEARDSDL